MNGNTLQLHENVLNVLSGLPPPLYTWLALRLVKPPSDHWPCLYLKAS